MSYQKRRRHHSDWPRLAREWKGRLVRLRRPIRTNGGTEFDEGTILVVRSLTGSKLHLQDTPDAEKSRYIRCAEMDDVELLPEETK